MTPAALPLARRPRLILPGWGGSGPTHWQSRWEALHGDLRVEQDDWQRPLRGDWMMRLEEALLAMPSEAPGALLIAHSLGCHLVAAWAAHSRLRGRVAGAWLVAPPDLQREPLPAALHSWRPPCLAPLPFPSWLIASQDDTVYCSLERAGALAAAWGAKLVDAGRLGHINADSGLGDWPQGRAWLDAFAATLPPS